MKSDRFDKAYGRLVRMAVCIGVIATLLPLAVQVAQAAEPIDTLATEYQPAINETIDANGFKRPGMGFTKEILENVRTQVRAKKEPWNTYFNNMLGSVSAGRGAGVKNVSATDPTKPRFYGLDSQGLQSLYVQDALTAYTQAILYHITGDEIYRSSAMRIIRLYAQMDPTRYRYYNDSHIHTGIPLSRMVGAAEILRATSTQTPALQWTEDDTVNFTNNHVIPVMQTFNISNGRFMNQHLYTTIARMSGAIFAGDREQYNQAVEWFTVNKNAVDQGQNGSVKQLFRLVTKNDVTGEPVTPVVQHVEMGRDQAHGAGDVTNAELLARLMMSQDTKVDPVEGTVSTESNAVGPYEFLGDRILDAAELFGSYMLGYEIPWVPTASHTDAYGNPTVVYKNVSPNYRGRTGSQTWELFYYYQYVRGINMEQRAPNFTRFFDRRVQYNWDSGDGGGDFWLFIPPQAEAEGGKYLVEPVVNPYREVEQRFTPLDGNAVAMNDGSTGYVRVTATPAGSKLAVFGYGSPGSPMGYRIRTNGLASIEVYGTTHQLPDTQGEWRYVLIPAGLGDFLPLTVTGAGTTVDIDHINIQAGTLLSAPAFISGAADLTVYTYAGSTLTTALDFSAMDANPADVVSYKANNLPQGASINTASGAFSWLPTQAGSYSLVIEASDGTSVSVKRVTIVVGADRQATLAAATSAYNPNTLYVQSTLTPYTNAYADMANVIGTASDALYFEKLASLRTLVGQVQQLTPLTSDDASMDFSKMLWKTSWPAGALVDNLPETSVNYTEARNHGLLLDFGPSFKVSANGFRLHAVLTFPERGGGIAILGSNDNENWTRLTPGMTSVVDDWQELAVQDDLKNNRYRFLRIQMVQPSSSLLQLGEFRIFGQRHETVNKLSAVSMGSVQALRTRVIAGDTVALSFQSTEPINTVNATIQGLPATITTTDNLNWTASLVLTHATPAGSVKFLLNYKTQDGLQAEPTFLLTDGNVLWISDQTNYIGNLLDITTMTDSSNRNTTDARNSASSLFDRNLSSGTDLRVNGSGYGGWLAFDFRGGGTALLSRVEITGKQDQFYTRINGAVVQGSNDYATWTTISNATFASSDWQTLTINSTTPYRYIRIYNPNQWFGNMTELRLYGVVASTNKIASTSISSAQALRTRIVPGDTVKVSFTAKEAINNVTATISNQAATVSTTDNISFTATAILPQGVAAGQVKFAINYQAQDGTNGYPGTTTTDGTSLNLVDESDSIKNIGSIATLIDPTSNRTAATTLGFVNNLFDGSLGSGSDFRIGTSGIGAYIAFDFKAGNQVNLSSVELAGSQDQYSSRMAGVVVQGSNDNAAWTTLTAAAVNTQNWQTMKVASMVPYRYLRIYNPNSWFGTMREVRFHGSVHGADTTAPGTTAAAPTAAVNTDTTVSLTAADNQGGSGVSATYFKVNGGAQQTGNAVTLTAEGSHTVAYWSVDWAGNVEPERSLTVNIDKTAPVSSATLGPALPKNGWYAREVTISLATNVDTGSGVAATYFKLDGGEQQTGTVIPLTAKGLHTIVYWSVDGAGNVEQPQTIIAKIGPLDVNPSVQVTQHGATLNRVTGNYVGSVTITNNSNAAIAEPLLLKLSALTTGITLDNASGLDAGAPYVDLPGALNPGASINVPLTFTNPARAMVSYTPQVYIGTF
jgi:hypothetical protein